MRWHEFVTGLTWRIDDGELWEAGVAEPVAAISAGRLRHRVQFGRHLNNWANKGKTINRYIIAFFVTKLVCHFYKVSLFQLFFTSFP